MAKYRMADVSSVFCDYMLDSECFRVSHVLVGELLTPAAFRRENNHISEHGELLWCHDVRRSKEDPDWLICCGIRIPPLDTVIRVTEDHGWSGVKRGQRFAVIGWRAGHTAHRVLVASTSLNLYLMLGHAGKDDGLQYEVVGTISDLLKRE